MKGMPEPNSLNSMEGMPPYNIPVKFEAEKNAEKVSIAPKEVSPERVFEHAHGQVLDLTASEVEIEKMKQARELQRQEALQKIREELGIVPQSHEPELGELAKPEKAQKSEKQLAWEEKLREIETWIDGEGRGLDQGIKETVAGFNLNGISTVQSCEGHVDRTGGQRAWPWVEVAALDEPQERFVGEGKFFEEAAQANDLPIEQLKKGTPEDVYWEVRRKAAENDETSEYKEWRRQNNTLREKTRELLQEFYRDRKVPKDIELVVDGEEGGSFEVHSREDLTNRFIFKELSEVELDTLIKKLPGRQAEMSAFAEFLKKKFLVND